MDHSDASSQQTNPSKSMDPLYHFLSNQELEYMNLIQTQIRPYFPKFATALADQTPIEREEARCAAIDFTEPSQHLITSFTTSAELHQYLEDSAPPPYQVSNQGRPRRRLFILEDLPCNHILALGSRFLIPPTFFAGHFEDPAASAFNHRNSFQRCSLPHFRLRYATSNRVELDSPAPGHGGQYLNIFAFNTRASRYLHLYDRDGLFYDEARSHHVVSFWSTPVQEDGSWDAVLLVDPGPEKFVRCLTTRKLVPLRTTLKDDSSMPKYFLHPELDVFQELPRDCSNWANAYTTPGYTSIFDDTLAAFRTPTSRTVATHDPLSVVEMPRRLVISITIAYMRRRYLNLVSIQNTKLRPHGMRHNYLASFSKSNYSSWSGDLFDFIVGSRAAIKEFSREMDENVASLGLNEPCCSAPQWEVVGWRSVKDLVGVVTDTVDAFAAGYLQFVTIQEAHVSGSNAQSLSKITVLTMLFIPLSTVASIFSMGGDFLPGQSRAWVFWIIAIPLLAMLVYMYWAQEIKGMWRDRKQQLLPLFVTVKAKAKS